MNSTLYSGCYGGDTTNVADILITRINCHSNNISMIKKQVIFVVDESGSMNDTMPFVKSSIFAFRNTLLRLLNHDIDSLSEVEKDHLFVVNCKSSLITFSDEAVVRWDSSSPDFTQAVLNLKSYNLTNMGDAIRLAYDNVLNDHVTWIILLTDGLSNVGNFQTSDSFTKLYNEKPSLTTIIPLGYTTSFDVDILSIFGNVTYIENEEKMSEVFGCIVGEIVTSYGFDATLTVPLISRSPPGRDIIGCKNIGSLYNDRKIMHGYLPVGNKVKNISYGDNDNVVLKYYDIKSGTYVTLSCNIIKSSSEVPDDVFSSYFSSSKARILQGIYRLRNKNCLTSKYTSTIIEKLNDWNHPSAKSHKEEILRILNSHYDKNNSYKMITRSHALSSQSGYLLDNDYTTPTQRKACKLTSAESAKYINL